MNKKNTKPRKKIVYNLIYATLIGLLILACAITIALVAGRNSGGEVSAPGNVEPVPDIPVDNNTFVVPVNDATVAKDYSGSELQYNNTLKQWRIHKAIDFVTGESADVMAVANGTVANIEDTYLYGKVVEITHANGLISIYKSLAKDVNVSLNEKVTAGQVIGKTSDSMAEELSTGAHLHLEMKLNGKLVNPNDYIALADK